MRRFSFRLQRLLDLAAQQEALALLARSKAAARTEGARRAHAAAEGVAARIEAAWLERRAGGQTGVEWREWEGVWHLRQEDVARKEEALAAAEADEARRVEELVAARRRRLLLATLRERRRLAYRQLARRRERMIGDEAAAQQYFRKGGEEVGSD